MRDTVAGHAADPMRHGRPVATRIRLAAAVAARRAGLVELGGEPFAGALAQGLLDELAGRLARRAGEAPWSERWFRLWATR